MGRRSELQRKTMPGASEKILATSSKSYWHDRFTGKSMCVMRKETKAPRSTVRTFGTTWFWTRSFPHTLCCLCGMYFTTWPTHFATKTPKGFASFDYRKPLPQDVESLVLDMMVIADGYARG